MEKMDPALKAQWVAALRSGQYTQGTGFLKRTAGSTTYCCLGVLCEITNQWPTNNFFLDSWWDLLPTTRVVVEVQHRLGHMNDGTGAEGRRYSFSEIADWIDANL